MLSSFVQKLGMPALSPTMTKGNIAKWQVKEGDEVIAGTVLADIETDKATLAFENQEEGIMLSFLLLPGKASSELCSIEEQRLHTFSAP